MVMAQAKTWSSLIVAYRANTCIVESMATNPPTAAPLYDDGDINAVYQAIKSKFASASEAWRAAIDVTSVITNRLIQKQVDEEFKAQVEAWHNGPHFDQSDDRL